MKFATYILAAIGLMFIGAIISDVLNSRQHAPMAPQEVEAIQILSGNGVSSEAARSIQQSQIESLVGGKSLPAQTAIVHDTWSRMAMVNMVMLGFFGMLAFGAMIVLRRGSQAHRHEHNDAAVVQELYHLGKDLETRMEALETILLERQRPANEL